MSKAENFARRVYMKMINKPPTAEEQAEMLYDAMVNYMKGGVMMDVKTVNEKFVKITGAEHDTKNLKDYAVVGRFGEVAVYEGVNEYFKLEDIQKRYGQYIIEGTAQVMIPADAHKSKQTRTATEQMLAPQIRKVQKLAFKEWKNLLPNTESMPDFFMKNAFPMEVKAKLNSYIFTSKKGESRVHAPSDRSKLSAGNAHLGKIGQKGGKVIVGGIWIDTIWEDVTKDIKEFTDLEDETVKRLKAEANEIGKQAGGLTLKYDWTLPKSEASKHGEGRLFKMVNLKINAFIPMAADKKDLQKALEQEYIKRSDMGALKASSEYTTDMLQRLMRDYEAGLI